MFLARQISVSTLNATSSIMIKLSAFIISLLLAAVYASPTSSSVRASLPAKCSMEYCAARGAAATCIFTFHVGSASFTRSISCRLFSYTAESEKECRILCPQGCNDIVFGSDGRAYCSPCHLRIKSCQTRYHVHGAPLTPSPSSNPTPKATSSPVPNPGPVCSMITCTRFGEKHKCFYHGFVSDCASWSSTKEKEQQCSFRCILVCLPFDRRPIASNGRRYCTVCALRAASCFEDFTIYGPLPIPTSTPSLMPTNKPVLICSMASCTRFGAKQNCKYLGSNSTCAKWAVTTQKREQCAFVCILICLPPEQQPIDNTGRSHCTACQLQSSSCARDFVIYGPVRYGGGLIR